MLARPAIPLLAALLALVPVTMVSGQLAPETSEVTFYGHIFGTGYGGPMPANTEKPIGEANYGLGSYDWCTPAGNAQNLLVPTPNGEVGCGPDDSNNKVVLFSTAGFVDVRDRAEFLQNGGYALLHNERGQTKDITLDPSRSITATIYLTLDLHAWTVGGTPHGTNCIGTHPPDVPCLYPYWGWDPGTQPDFVMEATLMSASLGAHGGNASDAPPIEQAIRSGEAQVIATGRVGPETVTNGLPGYPNALEFTVDLGPPQITTIPRDQDFFLVYSFYSETSGTQWGHASWRVWSGEFFPPTFTLPVTNAFEVERVIPNFAHGRLALLGVMNTPWGSYDVDPKSVELTVEGPSGSFVEPRHMVRFGDFSVAHGGHYLPVNVTWIWDYQADRLAPGTYTVTVSAQNFQHSAQASCSATFELEAAANGRLRPGAVEEGVCGTQTASDDFLDEIKQGASGTGGSR